MITCHILVYMFLNYQFEEAQEVLRDLGDLFEELKFLPQPYGLLSHDLEEIIQNEKILPGISFLYKNGEEFPYLNQFAFKQEEVYNFHQRILFIHADKDTPQEDAFFKTYKKYMKRSTIHCQMLKGEDFTNLRYTFVNHIFDYYRLMDEDLNLKLRSLAPIYIWNLYKQLALDILDKITVSKKQFATGVITGTGDRLNYVDIEAQMKHEVMERVKKVIMEDIPE